MTRIKETKRVSFLPCFFFVKKLIIMRVPLDAPEIQLATDGVLQGLCRMRTKLYY